MVSDSRKEELSALMDGEASELEVRRVLKELDENDELGARWSRYHTARAALHKEAHSSLSSIDISARIFAAIEAEPSPPLRVESAATFSKLESNKAVNSTAKKASPLASWWAQSAVAAGVAAVIVFTWQPWQQPGNVQVAANAAHSTGQKIASTSLPKLATDQRAFIPASVGGSPRLRTIPIAGSSDDEAMNPYIISHAGASVLLQQVGVPAARVINVSVGEGTAQ